MGLDEREGKVKHHRDCIHQSGAVPDHMPCPCRDLAAAHKHGEWLQGELTDVKGRLVVAEQGARDEWKQTKHNGLVYKGEDAGCVGYTIWDGDMLEIRIGGDDLGLDEAGLQRLALAIQSRLEEAIQEVAA